MYFVFFRALSSPKIPIVKGCLAVALFWSRSFRSFRSVSVCLFFFRIPALLLFFLASSSPLAPRCSGSPLCAPCRTRFLYYVFPISWLLSARVSYLSVSLFSFARTSSTFSKGVREARLSVENNYYMLDYLAPSRQMSWPFHSSSTNIRVDGLIFI